MNKHLEKGDRVLITGGLGFIGSNLAKELFAQGYFVDVVDDLSSGYLTALEGAKYKIVDNRNEREPDVINVFICSFDDERFMSTTIKNDDYVVVFHQAALPRVSFSVENPSKTNVVNVSSTVSLFEACVNHVSRIVFASSSSVYGGASELPTHESSKHCPKSPYALQKSICESYAKLFCELYNDENHEIDIVCLRYFNVFGPGQLGNSPYSTAISAWCDAIKNGRSLRSDGDGEQTRDMCYIDNVVHANIQAALNDFPAGFNGREYNIACGNYVSNNQILEFLKKRHKNITVIHAPERSGDVKHTLADIARAKDELDYRVKVEFWQGLEKTLNWWGI